MLPTSKGSWNLRRKEHKIVVFVCPFDLGAVQWNPIVSTGWEVLLVWHAGGQSERRLSRKRREAVWDEDKGKDKRSQFLELSRLVFAGGGGRVGCWKKEHVAVVVANLSWPCQLALSVQSYFFSFWKAEQEESWGNDIIYNIFFVMRHFFKVDVWGGGFSTCRCPFSPFVITVPSLQPPSRSPKIKEAFRNYSICSEKHQ